MATNNRHSESGSERAFVLIHPKDIAKVLVRISSSGHHTSVVTGVENAFMINCSPETLVQYISESLVEADDYQMSTNIGIQNKSVSKEAMLSNLLKILRFVECIQTVMPVERLRVIQSCQTKIEPLVFSLGQVQSRSNVF